MAFATTPLLCSIGVLMGWTLSSPWAFAVRWLPLSLYTFLITQAWLGVSIVKETEAFTEFDSKLLARFQTSDPHLSLARLPVPPHPPVLPRVPLALRTYFAPSAVDTANHAPCRTRLTLENQTSFPTAAPNVAG